MARFPTSNKVFCFFNCKTQDTVTNTFTVGDVKITLDEAQVNANGEPIDAQGNVVTELAKAKRVDANTYKLIPGHKYTKDPTVTVVKGSETSYVRILVTVNKVSELQTIFGANYDLETVFTGYSTDWERHSINQNTDGTVTYEYWYKDTVTPTAEEDTVLPALFTGITLPGTITNAQLATLDGFKMNVVAHAIQADGFNTASDAWPHFTTA